MKMQREIKFRVWIKPENFMVYPNRNFPIYIDNSEVEYGQTLMQYTGLKDKNVNNNICIYEGDIISLDGINIGNIYENKNLLEDTTNLIITEMGCETWRSTEQEAIKRGCFYAK